MAIQLPINFELSAGVDFSKSFTMKNDDQSPVDLTGYTFSARMSKYPNSQSVRGTSEDPLWRYIPFTVTITDATNGVYTLTMDADTTVKLAEGKYVYNITSQPSGGSYSNNQEGLVFVTRAFGYTGSYGSLDPNYP